MKFKGWQETGKIFDLGTMVDETPARDEGFAPIGSRMPSSRTHTSATTVLICPNENNRRTLTKALEGQQAAVANILAAYPSYNHLLLIIDLDCDAFIVDLDTDSDRALEQVEAICSRKPSATVMVYSAVNNPQMLIAAMRAGAREYLSGDISHDVMSDALLRAAARRVETVPKREVGKMLLFYGAKGGSGTTTVATNFAIALRRETGGEVALLDFHPQLGDVSLLLGLTPRFTIADALSNPARLDEDFISTLVTEHPSGVSVLAAPDAYTTSKAIPDASLQKLIELVGNSFPYFVVDAGGSLGASAEALFRLASTVYLVTQADIPSFRNCQRMITYLDGLDRPEVELVLNRYEPRKSEFDDERLSKALGKAPKWKVPNDYAAARRASNTGAPLASEKLAISQVLQQMARAACGKLPEMEKKKNKSLFS